MRAFGSAFFRLYVDSAFRSSRQALLHAAPLEATVLSATICSLFIVSASCFQLRQASLRAEKLLPSIRPSRPR
jgi:hypothetical protein